MQSYRAANIPAVLHDARSAVDNLLVDTSAAAFLARDLNEKFLLTSHAAHVADALRSLIGEDEQWAPEEARHQRARARHFDLRDRISAAAAYLNGAAAGLDPARDGRTLWAIDEAIMKIERSPASVALSAAPLPSPNPSVDLSPLDTARRASALQPWRPPTWRSGQDPVLASVNTWESLVSNQRAIGAMVHFLIADVEINVLDICCALIVDSEKERLPSQFRIDMAGQAWDEARHSVFLEAELHSLGYTLGEFAVEDKPWRIHQSLNSCLDQLVAQQIASEGNGIDAAGAFIAALRNAGRDQTAEAIVLQNRDEIAHCGNAVQWVIALCGGNQVRAMDEIERVVNTLGMAIPGPHPVDTAARVAAGFDLVFPSMRADVSRTVDSPEITR